MDPKPVELPFRGGNKGPGLFRSWPIRRKLLAAFLVVFAGTFLVNGLAARLLLGRIVQRQFEQELETRTTALQDLVRAAVDASAISYLRGIAEKNGEIMASIYARVQAGEMDEAAAKRMAAEILLAQRIGESGYIYVVDGRGIIRIHPKAELRGADLSGQALIQEQIRRPLGYLEYPWANPGEGSAKPMAFYMAFFQPWNWIITVSACRDEFRQFVKTSDFRDQILALRFGATGYPFLMDTQGNLLVHPDLEGKNILELRDAAEKPFIRELLAKKSGRLTYLWKDPGASTARERLLVFRYLPEMDWIVASSSCLEEFYLAGAQFAWITGVILLLSAALAGAATFAISRALTGSLIDLAERVSCVGEGSFDPLPVEGTDEVGTLAAAFNGFLARIQRSQHHLEESEGRYRRLFEQAVEGIFQCTREGRFLTANPSLAQTLGYGSPEEILAEVEHIREDLHLDPRTWMDLWCRLDSAGVVLGFQAELRRRDGRSVWVRINARAVNQGGASAYMEGFLSDITEEKHHREALVEQQRVLEDRVENRTSELRGGIERLERHNAEVAELHEFTEMLQLCQDLPEGIPIIEAFLPRLFSGAAAELFILDPISELLMPITQGTHDEFPVEACWALREGKPYARSATGSRPRCAHLEGLPSGDSLCLPVLAGRELHGLIQVLPAGPLEDELQRYGKNVAELLAITLTTLKLRVRLREQSIHDPLTGLYNRRYLDEVAHRELQRAARRGQPVGVALFDIDHFKRFNDEHGHDAGDAVLFQLTRFIESRLRAGDLAFRIGGEEFLLLLAEADREATLAKMEGFRREVETDLRVKHAQLNLTVTISAGVAAFPGDGTSLEDLLKAADTAMYRAKTMGRNCVFATGGSAPDTAPPV